MIKLGHQKPKPRAFAASLHSFLSFSHPPQTIRVSICNLSSKLPSHFEADPEAECLA